MTQQIVQLFKSERNQIILHYSLLSILLYLILFIKLGSFHMRTWDEAIFAVNAYEMLENGNYFTLYYNHAPDYFNTKPPLTTWLQLISIKTFGYNELAIRIPSAIATFLSVFCLFRFVSRHFNYTTAWVAAIVTITAAGYVNFHTARTGESDAILSFFLLLLNLHFIEYLLTEKKRSIFYFFLFLTLAFATKLYAAFLFIPAYLFALIYFKKLKLFVVNKTFLTGLFLFLLTSFLLIYLREIKAPGYFQLIWLNDAGRLLSVGEEFQKPFWFYIENFYEIRFRTFFIPLLLGCLLLFIVEQPDKTKKILLTTFALICAYLLIISLSKTKLPWYDMPLYPLFAIITVYPLYVLIKPINGEPVKLSKSAITFILIGLLAYPFYFQFSKSQGNKIDEGDALLEINSIYLYEAIEKGNNLDGLNVLHKSFDAPLLFYKYKLQEDNQLIQLHKNTANLKVGQQVLVGQKEQKDLLNTQFETELIDQYHTAQVFLIKKKRP